MKDKILQSEIEFNEKRLKAYEEALKYDAHIVVLKVKVDYYRKELKRLRSQLKNRGEECQK